MNPDVIDKSLKARIELFKIYIVLIIGLVTGIAGLSFKEFSLLNMLWIVTGSCILVLILCITFASYFKIRSLIKQLESL